MVDHAPIHPADLTRGSLDSPRARTVIGIVERVDLPEWDIDQLRVKIDTGARTSALHVDGIQELDDDRVRFWVILDRRHAHRRVQVETNIVRRARVRSSSGRAQDRLFVSTRMRVGGVEKTIEISLASREPMIFRMLLGRSALAQDFLVDPSNRYLQSPHARERWKARSAKKAEAAQRVAQKKAAQKKANRGVTSR